MPIGSVGIPIATDGASERNLKSGGCLSSRGRLGGAWVGGGAAGVGPSFPGPEALAQPSSRLPFLTPGDGQCHLTWGG